MKLRVVKSRNGLALLIPEDAVRGLGIKAGDRWEARITLDGALALRRPATWNRRAFAKVLNAARRAMPMGASVMDKSRRG